MEGFWQKISGLNPTFCNTRLKNMHSLATIFFFFRNGFQLRVNIIGLINNIPNFLLVFSGDYFPYEKP